MAKGSRAGSLRGIRILESWLVGDDEAEKFLWENVLQLSLARLFQVHEDSRHIYAKPGP